MKEEKTPSPLKMMEPYYFLHVTCDVYGPFLVVTFNSNPETVVIEASEAR